MIMTLKKEARAQGGCGASEKGEILEWLSDWRLLKKVDTV
jgi:hypothetical protein